jgi:hypothetical protein
MAARGARRQDERRMRIGRGRDRHRVDIGARQRITETGTRVRDAQALGTPGRARHVLADECDHVEARVAQCGDVYSTAETGADDRGTGH